MTPQLKTPRLTLPRRLRSAATALAVLLAAGLVLGGCHQYRAYHGGPHYAAPGHGGKHYYKGKHGKHWKHGDRHRYRERYRYRRW